ncbi:carbohydrate ABC transporter permease [Gryllotalpicola reticulitermitis]|uniref:Carbohydrate ABC transporter permease n=1 Tax=Gryllotalpicola reticulitermitis TaxID=1184153 RepID=A0ABV8Q3T3_9MICO
MSTALRSPLPAAGASKKPRARPGRIVAWIFLGVILFVSIFPFWWMVKEALTHNSAIFTDFGLWPKHPTLINFIRILGLATPAQNHAEAPGSLQTLNLVPDFIHSVIFTVIVAVCQVVFNSMSAYAFSRLKWRGRNLVFGIFLAGLLMPPIFAILPNFVTVKEFGWINTWPGLLAPYLLMQPFAIFFLRQFFLSIPTEVEEAAELDGLSKWGIYWRVTVPLSIAPISTLLIIQAVGAWNEYLWPLLVGTNGNTTVLTAALGNLVQNSSSSAAAPDWSGFMAAATLTVIPLVVFMALFGKRLVNNLSLSSAGK